MVKFYPKRSVLIFLTIVVSFSFVSCSGGASAVDATWSLVKLVSIGDPIENPVTETVEVKNCGEPIEKTTTCSAGTAKDLNMTLTSGGAFGIGTQFIIEGSFGTTIGIGQESGESVRLPTPPDGLIYRYIISKSYQIVTGQAIARSSSGDEQVVNFDFHASCSIDIVNKEQTTCSGNSLPSNTEPVQQLTIAPVATQSTNLIHGEPVSAESLSRIVGGDAAYWTQKSSVVWVYSNKDHNVLMRHPGDNMILTYWAGFGDPQNGDGCQLITPNPNKPELYVKCPPGTNAEISADQVGLHLIDFTGFFP